jgi:hypothetical protein
VTATATGDSRVVVSITAAASARLSGTSSVRPSGEIARRSGQLSRPEVLGGKLSGIGVPAGGGTAIVPLSAPRPLRRS